MTIRLSSIVVSNHSKNDWCLREIQQKRKSWNSHRSRPLLLPPCNIDRRLPFLHSNNEFVQNWVVAPKSLANDQMASIGLSRIFRHPHCCFRHADQRRGHSYLIADSQLLMSNPHSHYSWSIEWSMSINDEYYPDGVMMRFMRLSIDHWWAIPIVHG